ncbi:MAG TPA: aquaporin [Stellaceae bacterium]|nr:aquaporin [Stellaceae bacterium]
MRASRTSHWPEYLIEALGLGLFMVTAGICMILASAPGTVRAVASADLRRALVGIAMGLTAIAIVYSPWGRRSGAHLNPAVTLTFLRLGKVAPIDAAFYVLAQFAGGAAGTLLLAALLGERFTLPPVSAVATLPGRPGDMAAFAAEIAIAFLLMTTVLATNASARLMRWTGVCAGILVTVYIMIEAPVSGMSLNPARSVASALPSGLWHGIWIYLTAPLIGMLLAAEIHLRRGRRTPCAKLHHDTNHRCIFRCDFAAARPEEVRHV